MTNPILEALPVPRVGEVADGSLGLAHSNERGRASGLMKGLGGLPLRKGSAVSRRENWVQRREKPQKRPLQGRRKRVGIFPLPLPACSCLRHDLVARVTAPELPTRPSGHGDPKASAES